MQWMHIDCFLSTLQNVQAHEIENLENIRYEHQMEIIRHCQQENDQEVTEDNEICFEPDTKRFKSSELERKIEETEIKRQSAEFFSVRDLLQKCDADNLHLLLLMNECEVFPESEEELLDICAEFMTFGVLEKCQKCSDGEMVFAKFGYKCNGRINEWVKCGYFVEKPKRRKCIITEDLRANKILKQIEPKLEDRVLRQQNVNHSKTSSKALEVPWTSKMVRITNVFEPDSDFELHNITKVHQSPNFIFSCVLTLVDIEKNRNDFFKMQILCPKHIKVHLKLPKFYLFTSSGRIGSDQKESSIEAFDSDEEAIKVFEQLFLEKNREPLDLKRGKAENSWKILSE
jgi:predicted DNA-binding WGR domain protein